MGTFTLRVATDEGLSQPCRLDLDGLTEPLHLPETAMAPGRYWWQWSAGADRSEVFAFDITADAVPLEVPLAKTWLERLPQEHPRPHCRPEWVAQVRQRTREEGQLTDLLAFADLYMSEGHEIAEPLFLPGSQQGLRGQLPHLVPHHVGLAALREGR